MATLETINSTDDGANSLSKISGNFTALNSDKLESDVIDTDTSLSADSDEYVASQKATKAYVDAVSVPVKASGAEITTGTDDDKFATPKALADATVGKLGAAWSSFSPSWTSLTVGDGTNTGYYMQIGKTIFFRIHFVFGTTSAVSDDARVDLPVTSVDYGSANLFSIGIIAFNDADGGSSWGVARWSSTTVCKPGVHTTGSTYLGVSSLSSSVPFTWATGDELNITGCYEAA